MSYKKEIKREYDEKISLYREFSSVVRNIIEQFLNSDNIRFQLISNRAKDVGKLLEKIDRKKAEGKEYKKLTDIEDLAGVRIVFYLESDKEKFLQSFRHNFKTSISNIEVKYDLHGYRGAHIIFKLDSTRSNLPEYKKYQGLKCEIQVTSILYHAWSEVEHDIIYKPGGDAELLKTLGLDDLEKTFEKLMIEHIQAATLQLDYIYKKYEEIRMAGEILSSDFVTDISSSKTNDEIYKKLEVVENFYYKKPEETLAIVDAIFGRKPIEPTIIYHFQDQDLYGKTHKDIILKAIDLLSSIRYYKPNEILTLLSKLSLSRDKDIKQKALDVVKKFSKYDFNILTETKIGYSAQREALDFISAWSPSDQMKYFDFIEVVAKELLSSSVEGSTSGLNENSDYTLTIHFSAVQPTDFLKKLRRETIDFLCKLYQSIDNTSQRLRVITVFEEVTRTPDNVAYGDDLSQMIQDDVAYLLDIYRRIVFPKGKLTNELAVAKEVEERLYWIRRSEGFKNEELEALRSDILENKFYRIFRVLVGDPITYREEEGWNVGEQKRNEEIDKIVRAVTQKKLSNWIIRINDIASQSDFIDEWQFQPFKQLLRKLAAYKPQIAKTILKDAISKEKPLSKSQFVVAFLDGFRDADEFGVWDEFLNLITHNKSESLTEALVFSLNILPERDIHKSIRDIDIDILINIVKAETPFSYLRKVKSDHVLRYALINTLMRNYQRDPRRIENLLIEEITKHPEHIVMYFNQIPFAVHRKWLNISDLLPKSINLLKRKIIQLPDINWHVQETLREVGQRDFAGMMNVFYKRILKDAKRSESRRLSREDRYEPIPHHFNPDLQRFIAGHPDYPKYVEGWLANLTEDWSLYNWHIGHFIQHIGSRFSDIIQILIDKGDDKSLMKAARLMHSIDGVDFDLSIEIVRRTTNRRVISQVESNMYSTGVVSGEYGLVNAYEGKAKALEKYKEDKDRQVKKFAERMIRSFKESATRERQSADEEKQLRRIEFEG